jgi:hypothetical protein
VAKRKTRCAWDLAGIRQIKIVKILHPGKGVPDRPNSRNPDPVVVINNPDIGAIGINRYPNPVAAIILSGPV